MLNTLKGTLVILNFGMGIAALIYDAPVIAHLPWYAAPFIVICPLYPILLSLHLSSRTEHPWLRAFATIPPTVYGGLALCFYPLSMASGGFSWNDTGQIFWVLTYAVQAAFFLPTRVSVATAAASLFMVVSLIILYVTNSYGYLAIADLSSSQKLGLLFLGFFLVGLTTSMIKYHTLFNRSKQLAKLG